MSKRAMPYEISAQDMCRRLTNLLTWNFYCAMFSWRGESAEQMSTLSDVESDDNCMLSRALDVSDSCGSAEDIDHENGYDAEGMHGYTSCLASANSYVKSVRREARRVGSTVFTNKPVPHQERPVLASSCPSSDNTHDVRQSVCDGVSTEWRSSLEADFSDTRLLLASGRAHCSESQNITPHPTLASSKDEQWWGRVFCTGSVDILVSTVSRLSQCDVVTLLAQMCELWRDSTTVCSVSMCRWTLALLVALDKPVLPDCVSCLRQICRALTARAKLASTAQKELDDDAGSDAAKSRHSDQLILCLAVMFQCLVADYFSQTDLLQNSRIQ